MISVSLLHASMNHPEYTYRDIIGFVYFASWNYWSSTYLPASPHVGQCAGEPFAAVAGCLILSSYLVLFILFYLATYKKGGKKVGKTYMERATISMERKQVPTVAETEEVAIKVTNQVTAKLTNGNAFS